MPDPAPALPSDHTDRYAGMETTGVVEVAPSPSGLNAQQAATPCAGCGHAAIDHEVNVGEWRCLIDGCACLGFNQVSLTPRTLTLETEPIPLWERPLDLRAEFKRHPQPDQRELIRVLGLDILIDDRFSPDEMADVFLRRVAASGKTEALGRTLERLAAFQPHHPVASGDTVTVPGADGPEHVTLTIRPGADEAIAAGVAAAAAAIEAGGTPEDMLAAQTTAMEQSFADHDDALPIRSRAVPALAPPPRPPVREGLAIKFARQVLDDPPPPGPENAKRLEQPVKRSIITQKAREFCRAYDLKLSIRLDYEDPDDPWVICPTCDAPIDDVGCRTCGDSGRVLAEKVPFLFCEVLADEPDHQLG